MLISESSFNEYVLAYLRELKEVMNTDQFGVVAQTVLDFTEYVSDKEKDKNG